MFPSTDNIIREIPGLRALRRCPRFTPSALLALLLSCASASSHAEKTAGSEYAIKAAFLYNFTRFTSWPGENAMDTNGFNLCVVGSNPFGNALDSLAGKTVRNRPLVIRSPAQEPLAASCQMVFFSLPASERTADLLARIGDKPVLTVSDAEGFTSQGGIIQLRLVNRKIRFAINIDAADRAGLNISSKLLSLATIVHDENRAETP